MAIDLFQIEWSKLYPFETALNQPEANQGGVYALYKSKGKTKKLYYIGKSKDFSSRFSAHKQSTFHMMNEAERKRCFVCFGLILSFEKSRMSSEITATQLKNVENFLISNLQPTGCGESTKKRYTGNLPIVIINIGTITKPFEKFMSHSPKLLEILGKHATSPTKMAKRKTSSLLDDLL